MSNTPVRYPIGIQSFESLRNLSYLYIDKTELLFNLVTTSKNVFLSRPRRFGKSLLLSTLKAYFEGKKELFKGLAIEQLETAWQPHAVLTLSLATSGFLHMQVYDISAEEPEYVVQCMCGDITADRVYNEAGNEVTRIFTAYGSATTPKESAAFFEKKADNNWDVWICVKVGNEDFESFYTEVFHGDEQVNDPDGILYNQLMNRDYPVVQPQVLYVELDDFPVYEETLSTGEDWWIAYGRMLWEQYQQALQQTGAAG